MDDLIYKIALTLIPGVGNINGKNLIAYCGGVKAVFCEKRRTLLKIPGVGEQTVNSILNSRVLDRAEEEIKFLTKYSIQPLFYLDDAYPSRLKQCNDGPLLLFFKGTADLNNSRVIAMVGTRNGTEYGREMCRKIIEGLRDENVLVVSGLAYGIDTWSHKSAMDVGLNTVAVLGHSLDRIYPYANRSLAERMISNGGLLSEFISGTKPDRENFPMRNRIIAGMVDAVVVVEAGEKGGALITAEIANSYARDVFAVPGRVGDSRSIGCNYLIRSHQAALITSAEDIRYMLNWDKIHTSGKPLQGQLFIPLTEDENLIVNLLQVHGETDIDSILMSTSLLPSRAAIALLHLEFENVIKCLPGKLYRLL
ncbi:MAG: DNA-protecting protein DprA [Bacteroidales bacterium]|nr:DNA-protecting protein DprA [Bacteroidales bacterium]